MAGKKVDGNKIRKAMQEDLKRVKEYEREARRRGLKMPEDKNKK